MFVLKWKYDQAVRVARDRANEIQALRRDLTGAWVRNSRGQLQRHPLNTGNKETAA